MKRNKYIKILVAILMLACLATFFTACNKKPDRTKYTLTFIIEDEQPQTIVTIAGAQITPPTAPQKNNMRFIGWFLNDEGDSVALPTVMPAENRTYYARYESISNATQYALTFIIEGEQPHTIIDIEGAQITPPTAPQKNNMRFVGWFLNNTGSSVTLPTVMPAENRVYYARYENITGKPQIPEDYNLRFDENDSKNHLYLKGEDAYIEFNDTVIISALSTDGDYVEFSANKKDYCVVLDYDNATYDVLEYGMDKNAYLLYVPLSDTFDFERCLYFDANDQFRLLGYVSEAKWADGTYQVFNVATKEYDIKVVNNNTYGLFSDCRVKLSKRIRQSEDTGAKPVIYNSFSIFDKSIFGSFSYRNQSLQLDGYGFATYTDEQGNKVSGVCETTEVAGFSDEFINFTDPVSGDMSIFVINAGDDKTMFLPVGDEIGIYRIYDVTEQVAGSYYLLLNGSGSLYVFYGNRTAFYPETEVAQGKYEMFENGEILYKFESATDDSLLTDLFRSTFRFKLTYYGSSIYATHAFVVYDASIAGTWSAENGASSILLDGYGNATHNDGGNNFTGKIQMYDDLLLITGDDDAQRIFRFRQSGSTVTYRQIGLEIGNYTLYSYVKGLKDTVYLHFDGEGKTDYYVFDKATNQFVLQKSGTYAKTENDGEFEITFSASDKLKVATRQINFGSLYDPIWKTVYIEYDAAMAGTFKNAAGTATVILDGYGLNGTYTDEKGKVYTGEFAKEWNLITFLAYDTEGYTDIITFKLTGNIFEIKTGEAGVHYVYDLESDMVNSNIRLFLDGDGNALYSVYNNQSEDFVNVNATYSYNKEKAEYTLNPSNGAAYKFILAERGESNVYIVYNENWKGSYVDDDEHTLELDGYGYAYFRDEKFACSVFGKNYDTVVFDGRTFVLNKTNNTFGTTIKPVGIYYPYANGTVSGYTRLIINADDTAGLYSFSEDSNTYVLENEGSYTKNGDIFSFTSTNGKENFTFKLTTVGAYSIFRTQDDYAATLSCPTTILGETKILTLILDGYGSATFNFFDKDEGHSRQRVGYYYYSETEKLLAFVATNEQGTEYATYIITVDWDASTFEIVSEQ